jgi:hypothetical protein
MKIFLEIIALVLSIGAPIYWLNHDFRRNILAIFVMLIFSAYVVLPLIFIHELSLKHYLDIQVESYIQQGLMLDILFMGLFVLGYELLGKKLYLKKFQQIDTKTTQIQHIVITLYLIIFSLVFLNNAFADIDLVGKWLGYSNQMTYGVKGLSYYLQNLVDSLVMLILIAYASNLKKKYLVLMLIGAIFFIIPFGFRYRLIYLILGFFILFFYKNQLSVRNFLAPMTLMFFLVLAFLFLGANRTIIVGQDHTKQFTFQLLDVNKIVMQARGSYVDLAIYQGIENGDIVHDHGKSFFYYTLIRAIPASYFEGGIKPYPPILMQDVDKVLNLQSPPDCPGCRTGEAQTIMGAVYYSFGAGGIAVIAILIGCLLRFHANQQKDYLSMLWGLVTFLALFMFITRGYFPQVIDNWFYLALPLIFLEIWRLRHPLHLR